MKADLYTKTALTVIAVALCALAFQDMKVISEARAQSQSVMQEAISYCWDHAKIISTGDGDFTIRTYC